jgi:hypothetical protein
MDDRPAESGPPAVPPISDARLLEELEHLVPSADSAEYAALTLKPLKRALVEKLGPGAKLSNDAIQKLVRTLDARRAAPALEAKASFQTHAN